MNHRDRYRRGSARFPVLSLVLGGHLILTR
jgi:hypothetical protein